MLSGEGKENGEKATMGLTLFVHFFAVVLHDYSLKLPGYPFCGGNIVRVLIHFFFTFMFTLVSARISYFPTAATKFSCCSSNEKMSPLSFISRSSCLSLFFSLNFAGLSPTFSFSLSFSRSIFQICGHDK